MNDPAPWVGNVLPFIVPSEEWRPAEDRRGRVSSAVRLCW